MSDLKGKNYQYLGNIHCIILKQIVADDTDFRENKIWNFMWIVC